MIPDRVLYYATVLKRLGGWRSRECPMCGHVGRFHASGHPVRYDSVCGGCGSRERLRLLALALQAHPIAKGADILHFAPEARTPALLKPGCNSYKSADLVPGRGDIVLNMEQIDLPDCAVDVIVANQILEHVDDRMAMPELLRVLRPGGVLIATVPLIEGWDTTYENPAVQTDRDRSLHFGQGDHVRYYGRDFRERLRSAGFELTEFVADGASTVQYGLTLGERIFFCTRPAAAVTMTIGRAAGTR